MQLVRAKCEGSGYKDRKEKKEFPWLVRAGEQRGQGHRMQLFSSPVGTLLWLGDREVREGKTYFLFKVKVDRIQAMADTQPLSLT